MALSGRNDLELPALALCPPIGDVLGALGRTGAWLSRMSGSGATCFALFESGDALREAEAMLAVEHPGWWRLSGKLR
jgi:4-diphosphocytidyl-2-C-methyl-D-erythritol kinase